MFARIALIVALLPSLTLAGIREASVRVSVPDGGGFNVGSGVLVARDVDCLYGVTCGHAFNFDRSKVGRLFNIETTGYVGTAKLLDLSDRTTDAAVFCCAKIPNVDVIPISTEPLDEGCPVTIAGFIQGILTQRQGSLDASTDWWADEKCTIPLCRFNTNGSIIPGMSGGPVVQNGKLYSVLSASDPGPSQVAYTAAYSQFYRYVEKERTNCFGGRCRKVRIIQRGPAPAQQPKEEKQVFGTPKKPEKPTADVPPPADIPPANPPAPAEVSADRPDKIASLEAKIDRISEQVAGLAASSGRGSPPGKDGQPGPAGPPGKDGRDGKDADPAELAQLRSDVASLKAFRDGLINQRITVPVKPVPKK